MTDETFTDQDRADPDYSACVEQAREWLAAVLVGAGDDDLDTVLAAGEALSVLNDATPPPPPLQYPSEGVPPGEGLPPALGALVKAGATAPQVADAARIARAADILTAHPSIAE